MVSRINFVGNRSYSDTRLRDVVQTREQAFYRLFSTSDTFDPDRLSFDRELLRRYYLRNGFADVEIGNATAELAPDRSSFFITYNVTEGPRYRFGAITVNSAFPTLDTSALRSAARDAARATITMAT